jgi:hypothetical protein
MLHGSRQGADGQDFVGSEAFDVRLPNRYDGDRLPECVEYLQYAARFSSFRVEDGIDHPDPLARRGSPQDDTRERVDT